MCSSHVTLAWIHITEDTLFIAEDSPASVWDRGQRMRQGWESLAAVELEGEKKRKGRRERGWTEEKGRLQFKFNLNFCSQLHPWKATDCMSDSALSFTCTQSLHVLLSPSPLIWVLGHVAIVEETKYYTIQYCLFCKYAIEWKCHWGREGGLDWDR